jgi:ribonuclease VapC
MVLDASAIIAILARESEAASLLARLGQTSKSHVTPVAIYEAVAGLARSQNIAITDARRVVERLLQELSTELVPIDGAMGGMAIEAFECFGKGRHKAALNMGDCFAYACAKALSVPLLFKGDDFPLTDVEAG